MARPDVLPRDEDIRTTPAQLLIFDEELRTPVRAVRRALSRPPSAEITVQQKQWVTRGPPLAKGLGVRRLLDPTLDIVFKLLFTSSPAGRELLVSLLTAVLRPPSPIDAVTVLNPEIEKDGPDDKGIVLDLLVSFAGGALVNIEMQAVKRPGFTNRIVYYWARTLASQLVRGADYVDLRPVIAVLFLDYSELPVSRLHSVFQLLEVDQRLRFSDLLEVHLIELPQLARLGPAELADAAMIRWARFLRAKTDEEIQTLAMSDPTMEKAKAELERLSDTPLARFLAERRELEVAAYRKEVATLQQAAVQARAEGRLEGRVESLLKVLELRGIPLSPEERLRITSCSDATAVELWTARALVVKSAAELFEAV